jgi:glycosyltransferase involved in cell wall biosynthesis
VKPLRRDAPPLVSVIVPSYNQGPFVRQTIDSILAQDYRPLEVLVVDGGSGDETVPVLRSYAVPELRWRSEPDKGVVDAVNKGLAQAKGEVIAIQSSDDYYAGPDVLSRALETFFDDPELGIVYGDSQKIDEQGRSYPVTALAPYSLPNLLAKRTRIPQESAFVRRDALEGVGGWREEVAYAADADFYLRIALRTKAYKLDRCISFRRMHRGQRDEQGEQIIQAYRRSIEGNADVQALPWRLRRAAAAGIHGTIARYSPSPWRKTLFLYRALITYPPTVSPLRQSWPHLVPGLVPLLSALGRWRNRSRQPGAR